MTIKEVQRSEHRFSIAPMMDWTDRHCRYFHRLLSQHALLYTEMIVSDAVVKGDRQRLLRFDPAEHPVALQIGGSDPAMLAEAARIGADFGYDEINLNVGCPSNRVQSGAFGACLMKEPDTVARGVCVMRAAVDVPVTVKCRTGVDDDDPNVRLRGFIKTVGRAGCDTFIVHARKAWLDGLSPKENREIPPLDYELIEAVKAENPNLTIVLNGGITDIETTGGHLAWADGVMMGRAAYDNPWLLSDVDQQLFSEPPFSQTRREMLEGMVPYIETHLSEGGRLSHVTRHMLGLFAGQPSARAWRRYLSEQGHGDGPGVEVLLAAAALVDRGDRAAA